MLSPQNRIDLARFIEDTEAKLRATWCETASCDLPQAVANYSEISRLLARDVEVMRQGGGPTSELLALVRQFARDFPRVLAAEIHLARARGILAADDALRETFRDAS